MSNALLMSVATSTVQEAGCGQLKPSRLCCVRSVCVVVVGSEAMLFW